MKAGPRRIGAWACLSPWIEGRGLVLPEGFSAEGLCQLSLVAGVKV